VPTDKETLALRARAALPGGAAPPRRGDGTAAAVVARAQLLRSLTPPERFLVVCAFVPRLRAKCAARALFAPRAPPADDDDDGARRERRAAATAVAAGDVARDGGGRRAAALLVGSHLEERCARVTAPALALCAAVEQVVASDRLVRVFEVIGGSQVEGTR